MNSGKDEAQTQETDIELAGLTSVSNDSVYTAVCEDRDRLIDENDIGEREVMRIRQGSWLLRKMRANEIKTERKFRLEGMGVERLPEDKKSPPNILNMIFFWFSFSMSPAFIPTGIMGPRQGLSVNASIGITVVAVCFGSLIPAFTSTLCASTGLRQLAVSRFAFGIWGSKLCCLFSIVVNTAYGIVFSVMAGQCLTAVSGGSLSVLIGMIITFSLAFKLSIIGFSALRHYLQYAWMPIFILLCVQYGQAAKYFSSTPGEFISPVPTSPPLSGASRTAAGLNYFALVFGQSAAWSAIIGDYYVHFPANTSKSVTFGLTWVGLVFPSLFVTILGNLFGGVLLSNQELAAVFGKGGAPALMLATLSPSGWAGLVGVMYSFSLIASVAALIYSGGLSFQLFGKHFHALPRYFWTVIAGDLIIIVAWPGKDHIMDLLRTAIPLVTAWTTSFGTILAIETCVFRSRTGFDLMGWQDRRRTPVGLAGVGTLILAYASSFLGLTNYFFVGPAAKTIGLQGGDVSLFFTFATTLLLYPCLRSVEIRLSGR